MSDVGRCFRATRLIELDIVLDESDVVDQRLYGESAKQTAILIAGSTPISEWTIVGETVEPVLP